MAQESVSADAEGKFKCTDFTYLAVTQGTDVSVRDAISILFDKVY
jgi:hypothetical protein